MGLEHLQSGQQVYGYHANRIIDALNGIRSGIITISSLGNSVILDGQGLRGYDSLSNNTFNLNAADGSVTIKGSLTSGSTITGASISGGSIVIGSGNSVFKADSNGMYLGNATFAVAPFRVDMTGAVTAKSFQLLDGSNNIIADNIGLQQVVNYRNSTGSNQNYHGAGPTQVTGSQINVNPARPVSFLVLAEIDGAITAGTPNPNAYISQDNSWGPSLIGNRVFFTSTTGGIGQFLMYTAASLSGAHNFSLYIQPQGIITDTVNVNWSLTVIQFGN